MELVPLLFQTEVSELCGIRWKHTPTKCQRWGPTRVRNTETNQEVPLETYKLLHQPEPGYEQELARSVLFSAWQEIGAGDWFRRSDQSGYAKHLLRLE